MSSMDEQQSPSPYDSKVTILSFPLLFGAPVQTPDLELSGDATMKLFYVAPCQ